MNTLDTKKTFHYLLSVLLGLSSYTMLFAQERNCASNELLQMQLENFPEMEYQRQLIEQHTAKYMQSTHAESRGIITIPVVVHILWRSSYPDENIPDAQIITQIEALNKDFAMLNADISKVPLPYKPVTANIGIQFALAKRTPWGALTNGINRYQSSRVTTWGATDDIKNPIKGGVQAWDTKKYLNIWIGAIGSNILGYAQFPGGPVTSDGVVLDYLAVGVNGTARAPFNMGRTATHEIGHWMNLYHLWGGGACGDDMVTDTPPSSDPSYGCPKYPFVNSCNGKNTARMTMNFMDYSNDQCMYMFTNGQKDRIQALFAAGGPKESLMNSDALTPGVQNAACGTTTILPISDLYATSATINWKSPEGATTFLFRFKASAATTWTQQEITATSYTVTGLTPNTDYQFQVQSICYGNPGSFSNAITFRTPIAVSCGIPQTLSVTNIAFNGASIKWNKVPDAVQYKFQLKRASSTAWTTYALNSNSCVLNLSASTKYDVRVAALCGSNLSDYSSTVSFTTLAPPPVCPDIYESLNNNTQTTAAAIPLNTAINATIATSSDVDWFYITTTTDKPHLQINLTNLKANFGLKLYNSSGLLIASSDGLGTANEKITYNNGIAGKYYIVVYNNNGSNNPYYCYALIANNSAVPFNTGARLDNGGDVMDSEEEITEVFVPEILDYQLGKGNIEVPASSQSIGTTLSNTFSFKIYPNPVTNNAVINVNNEFENDTPAEVVVLDAIGREVMQSSHYINAEHNKIVINLAQQTSGLYLVKVSANNNQQIQRIVVNH